jgi:hypothetical protein
LETFYYFESIYLQVTLKKKQCLIGLITREIEYYEKLNFNPHGNKKSVYGVHLHGKQIKREKVKVQDLTTDGNGMD